MRRYTALVVARRRLPAAAATSRSRTWSRCGATSTRTSCPTRPGGWTTIDFRNTGEEPHEFALFRLDEGKTIADVKALLADPASQQQGPPSWVTIVAGVPTLDAGAEASLTQKLEPGRHVLICFLDGPSGRPHFVDGMIRELEVAGDDRGDEGPKPTPCSSSARAEGAGARGRRAHARVPERRRRAIRRSSSSRTSREDGEGSRSLGGGGSTGAVTAAVPGWRNRRAREGLGVLHGRARGRARVHAARRRNGVGS